MSEQNSEWREREVGALWLNDRGTHFTGTVTVNGEKVKVVAFNNKEKKFENAPDFSIYKSLPKPENTEEAPTQTAEALPEGLR